MTWHIHLNGQVQGVGFRPFVYQLAHKCKLTGWVNNTTNGVHIEFNADKRTAHQFYQQVIDLAPALARITAHQLIETEKKFFDNFQIIHSTSGQQANLLLTPDFALCEDCAEELKQVSNRRFAYPFITCTNCGPRFSIVQKLPYDREFTTMKCFQMCTACEQEYNNPDDRRYYSQTNSCQDCGIQLQCFDTQGTLLNVEQANILSKIVDAWQAGKIVAIKGIGGYLLTCDATNASTIELLRKRKHRPSKPFALMFPDIAAVTQAVKRLTEAELSEMNSPAAPIVLLPVADNVQSGLAVEHIAPGLNQLGIMLPYAPIFSDLLRLWKKPIIATSGNPSKSPIVFQNDKAINELGSIADLIVTNNRQIVVPQDDSVVRFSPFHRKRIVIRRSRGLAPTYINAELQFPKSSILATGAEMKSSFSFLHQGNTYISQYLGDLEQFDTQENYRHVVQHFLELFDQVPEKIISDLHPGYAATQYAKELASQLQTPLISVQHHEAHFCAVLGENNLLETDQTVLGVIWDGTGLGTDQQIWGGEFFVYKNKSIKRVSQFDYFDFILGDKMPREPRISALSLCKDIPEASSLLQEKFTSTEWRLYTQMLRQGTGLKTSSVGRLFDAVASLLGIMDKQSFEGEAAMHLEALAMRFFEKNGLDALEPYPIEPNTELTIDTKAITQLIIKDIIQEVSSEQIAARFHCTLVNSIHKLADNLKIKQIAFSGGVFQNALLVDLCVERLGESYELFFHQQLSPNDENISFGQLVYSTKIITPEKG